MKNFNGKNDLEDCGKTCLGGSLFPKKGGKMFLLSPRTRPNVWNRSFFMSPFFNPFDTNDDPKKKCFSLTIAMGKDDN